MSPALRAATILTLALAASALADDGILYYHGEPRLLKGGAKIRMVQEFVRAKIGRNSAKVYCRFVLRNEGEATIARIGFPDGTSHDFEYIESTERPKPELKRFRSVVDGRPVRIMLERADIQETDFAFFHTKKVRFARGQTRVIEDWYEVPLDASATSTPGFYVYSFGYTMWSGASWKGNIGRATVVLDFESRRWRRPVAVPLSGIGNVWNYSKWNSMPRDRIFWEGFAKPTMVGRRMTFRRQNFDPGKEDDVRIYFGEKAPE